MHSSASQGTLKTLSLCAEQHDSIEADSIATSAKSLESALSSNDPAADKARSVASADAKGKAITDPEQEFKQGQSHFCFVGWAQATSLPFWVCVCACNQFVMNCSCRCMHKSAL